MADKKLEFSDIGQKDTRRIVWLVMWMTTLGQAAMTLYIPAFPNIATDLHWDPLTVKTSLTFFLLGYGLSQLFYGPLSDHYGRKPILLLGIAIFCVSCIFNAAIHQTTAFFLLRLCQGIGCGATITIGRAILRDCFVGRELAKAAAYLSMGFALSLGVSPIIGAYLQTYFSWRADFIFLALIGATLFLIFWRFLPETNIKLQNFSSTRLVKQTIRNYQIILADINFLKFMLGGLFAYAVVVAYNVMTPFLIQNVMGYSANNYGWLTALIATAYFLAAVINRRLVAIFSIHYLYRCGFSLIFFSGLILAIVSVTGKFYLPLVIAPMMLATFGQALIFSNTIAAALHHFPKNLGGSASAALSSLQMLLISGLSALMAIPENHSPLPLAIAVICLGLLSGATLWHCGRSSG